MPLSAPSEHAAWRAATVARNCDVGDRDRPRAVRQSPPAARSALAEKATTEIPVTIETAVLVPHCHRWRGVAEAMHEFGQALAPSSPAMEAPVCRRSCRSIFPPSLSSGFSPAEACCAHVAGAVEDGRSAVQRGFGQVGLGVALG